MRKVFDACDTASHQRLNGSLLAATTLAAAVALPPTFGRPAAPAQSRYYSQRSESARYQTRGQPRYQKPPRQRQSTTVPTKRRTGPDRTRRSRQCRARPAATRGSAPTRPKTRASYRIDACTAIIASGRLRGEALGVAYALRGLAHLDRGDIPHAIGDLNHAIELAPDFAPAYQNRGNAWYARGNFGQALADYDKTIELDPNSPSPYVNRAARAPRPRLQRRRAGRLPEGDQPARQPRRLL